MNASNIQKHSVAGIVFKNNCVLIAKRINSGQMGGRWEFPGGKVEKDETWQDALIREFNEEFSVDIKIGKHITDVIFKHQNKEFMLHAYNVFIQEDDANWVLTEHTNIKWVPLGEIKSLEFVDSDLLLYDDVVNFFSGVNNL